MSPLLDIQGLHIAFGDHVVVKGVNLQLAAGEKLALVGESGSGKTLTALSLLGLIPDARVSGSAMLAGTDLLALRGEAQRAVRGADVALRAVHGDEVVRHPRYRTVLTDAAVVLHAALTADVTRQTFTAHLDHIDVEIIAEAFRQLCSDLDHQVHADRHVGRHQNRRLLRGLGAPRHQAHRQRV